MPLFFFFHSFFKGSLVKYSCLKWFRCTCSLQAAVFNCFCLFCATLLERFAWHCEEGLHQLQSAVCSRQSEVEDEPPSLWMLAAAHLKQLEGKQADAQLCQEGWLPLQQGGKIHTKSTYLQFVPSPVSAYFRFRSTATCCLCVRSFLERTMCWEYLCAFTSQQQRLGVAVSRSCAAHQQPEGCLIKDFGTKSPNH